MPSRIDTDKRTMVFDYPVMEHWEEGKGVRRDDLQFREQYASGRNEGGGGSGGGGRKCANFINLKANVQILDRKTPPPPNKKKNHHPHPEIQNYNKYNKYYGIILFTDNFDTNYFNIIYQRRRNVTKCGGGGHI